MKRERKRRKKERTSPAYGNGGSHVRLFFCLLQCVEHMHVDIYSRNADFYGNTWRWEFETDRARAKGDETVLDKVTRYDIVVPQKCKWVKLRPKDNIARLFKSNTTKKW